MSDFQCDIMFKKVLEKPQKPPNKVAFLFLIANVFKNSVF